MAEVRIGHERLALLKPETYMNDSGRSVGPAAAFFKLEPGEVLVVHDEGDFDLGRLELKVGGGLAGHNGLRSIARELGTQDFLRLRIGVGRPERGDPRPLADWLLANFEPHDDPAALVARAADAVELLLAEGVERTQLQVNRR
jgi:PTH1 family peptidyl-tRNA hydrolase